MNKYNSRTYSRLGKSGSIFGISLVDQKDFYPLVALSADMSVVAGLDRFKSMYPDSFYNVGIAEQNLIGLSAGLASEGNKVVAVAQAAFITMRCFEQVRQYMGYMHNPIITIGINSGFSLTYFGNTHFAIEDLSLMRSIPNMVVLSPADAGEAVKCFEAALILERPAYIRITGGLNDPIVYKDDFDFKIGKINTLRDGNDIVIFATGSMVAKALKVSERLNEIKVSTKIIDVHTLKPFDDGIFDSMLNYKLIVTVEEHSILGGLGSVVAEGLSSYNRHPKLLRLGVRDCFSVVGDYDYLLNQHRLTEEYIYQDIINELNKQV